MVQIKAIALWRQQAENKRKQIPEVEKALPSSLKSLLLSQLQLPLSFLVHTSCLPPPHRASHFTSKNILAPNY